LRSGREHWAGIPAVEVRQGILAVMVVVEVRQGILGMDDRDSTETTVRRGSRLSRRKTRRRRRRR